MPTLWHRSEVGEVSTIQDRINTSNVRTIARDAYIYGFPLVDNYRIQYSYFEDRGHPEYKAPWNCLFHNPGVATPSDQAAQTPNSDTPYSLLGADLHTQPLVLTVPRVEEGRYYSVQFIDMYTHNFAYVGSRTTGNAAGRFLLAGPRWAGEIPEGISNVIRCETEFAFVLYRTQLRHADDLPAVRQIQEGYRVQTLSAFLGRTQPPARKVKFIKPLDLDEERTDLRFYAILNFVLQFCPTHISETTLMAQFGRLGIGADKTFQLRGLPGDVRCGIQDGMSDAWRAYRKRARQFATGERTTTGMFGSRENFAGDYLTRMVGVVDGIYGNSKEEAIYCVYSLDADGKRLDAAKHRYQLRFLPGQLPPAKAFWSLTMYDLPTRLLVTNQINRYLISSAMLRHLVRDADGGITLYIQRNQPCRQKVANWLPAADGPFLMALRLYWPGEEAIEGRWHAPLLERVSADH